ncbi:hypothetical protein C2I18_14740 [Paenibacillus sp. PK3_47]|uniref:hypothetical protein n=1 Tax=Paenibacillus sp. PK3_47 TaxID=2072642 RepID=UPI00201D89D2|nr:hypothetical protein [Paenibacillus sp. PK3_47]UQZ34671.1 hypothetical protein C2I18_14740 [Paenibacillus sp. PK3_47]
MMNKKMQNKLFLAVCGLNMITFSTLMDTNGSPVRDFIQGIVIGLSAAGAAYILWTSAKERKGRA